MPSELVGKLPSSSFHLPFIFLSHSGPVSLTHLHLFTTAKALLFYFSFTLCFTLALSLSLPFAFLHLTACHPPALHLSHTIPPSWCLSFTDDLGSHSLSLPFMKLLMLFPALPSSISLSVLVNAPPPPGPRLPKSSCSKNTGTLEIISTA